MSLSERPARRANVGSRAGRAGEPLGGLGAAELARLDTWAVDIARHVRGSGPAKANGGWRFGRKGGLAVHPDAWFYDFSAGKGGRGGLPLISHLLPDSDPVAWAREWLGAHEGFGGCKSGTADDDGAAEALDDAERVAMIEAIWRGATPIDGDAGPSLSRVARFGASRGGPGAVALPRPRARRGRRADRRAHRQRRQDRRDPGDIHRPRRPEVRGPTGAQDDARPA